MPRLFSTFAMAGWTGFHGVSAFTIAASGTPGATPAALLLAHGALAASCLGITAMLQTKDGRVEAFAFAALAASLAAAAGLAFQGLGAGSPGTFAAAVAATCLALLFDRAIGSGEGEEDVDHRAFLIEAGRLGAEMGRADPAGRAVR